MKLTVKKNQLKHADYSFKSYMARESTKYTKDLESTES